MALPSVKNVHISSTPVLGNLQVDLTVVIVDESQIKDGALVSDDLKRIDSDLGGAISHVVGLKDFDGKWLQNTLTHIRSHISPRLLLIGAGSKTDLVFARARQIGIKIAEDVSKSKAKTVAITGSSHMVEKAELAAQVSLGLRNGLYKYPNRNLSDEARKNLETSLEITLVSHSPELRDALFHVEPVARATQLCRLLQDSPPNVATPTWVAEQVLEKAKALGLKTMVWGRKELQEAGFHAMLAVASGSAQDPKFVVIEYKPDNAKTSLALVGKGLTMDTGGYSLKTPSTSQEGMKYDMSGAAVTLSSVLAIAELKLPIHVWGIGALCENMVDAHSYRVGDVISTHSGKTIEVINTDAEGRIVLSDALSYTQKELKPQAIVEYSTLTGAMLHTLGRYCAGVFSFNGTALRDSYVKASEKTAERVWEMPCWEEFNDDVKADIADLRNLGKTSANAGSTQAAAFLKEFVGEVPFLHVDIAGVADGCLAMGYTKGGGSGWGVQISVELARLLSAQ